MRASGRYTSLRKERHLLRSSRTGLPDRRLTPDRASFRSLPPSWRRWPRPARGIVHLCEPGPVAQEAGGSPQRARTSAMPGHVSHFGRDRRALDATWATRRYGERIMAELARALEADYGRGFAGKNLRRMVQLAEPRCRESAELESRISTMGCRRIRKRRRGLLSRRVLSYYRQLLARHLERPANTLCWRIRGLANSNRTVHRTKDGSHFAGLRGIRGGRFSMFALSTREWGGMRNSRPLWSRAPQ
jgi:hypothetical protein